MKNLNKCLNYQVFCGKRKRGTVRDLIPEKRATHEVSFLAFELRTKGCKYKNLLE